MIKRVVMVSGANRGLGLAIAAEMGARGWHVSAGVRNPGAAAALEKKLDPASSLIAAYDATNNADAASWTKATLDKFGQIDALVVNAGISFKCGIADGKDDELDQMWQVNAKAPWVLVRAALEPLKKSGSGRVVLVSSIAGKRIRAESYTGYSMSKFALMALGQGLRLYGFEHGIRVSAIMPGIVASDMTKRDGLASEGLTQPETFAKICRNVIELPNDTYIPEIGVANRLETGWA
jgi:NAD(P)-dependent dehydrogenase (short-subunit alcohol dehydrogenase family)